MKVVILCGGKGTRIREETEYKPKPMIQIGGKPILWHIMKTYAKYGHTEFILCLGYMQHAVRDYFLNYECMNSDFTVKLSSRNEVIYHNSHMEDWVVTLVDTGEDTKKGARIKQIQKYIGEEEFMITYGDGISDININQLIDEHKKNKKLLTFTGVNPISRFATVDTDDAGKICGWHEKKKLEGYINAGFFVLSPKVFDYIDGDVEFEEEPLVKLASERQVNMYKHKGFWQCMDTYRDYTFLNGLWNSNNAPWKKW